MAMMTSDINTLKSLLIRAIERRGFTYETADVLVFSGRVVDALGASDGVTKEVKILNSLSSWEKMRVTAHELSHIVLGHNAPTMDNFFRSLLVEKNKNIGEIDAELTAYGVLAAFGLEDKKVTSNYISGWARDMGMYDPNQINTSRVELAMPYIVSELIMDSFFSNFATASELVDA